LRLLRRAALALLREFLCLENFCLGIHLVETTEIVRLNEEFLRHKGSTDVITFDYAQGEGRFARPINAPAAIEGEIFICLDEAVSQARKFRVSWQKELARYVIHGVLHLCGHNDLRAGPRRRMKLEEDRLLQELERKIPFAELQRRAPR
jgi:rRNA maturation RNase YbeY